jgi:hypothetical protein
MVKESGAKSQAQNRFHNPARPKRRGYTAGMSDQAVDAIAGYVRAWHDRYLEVISRRV